MWNLLFNLLTGLPGLAQRFIDWQLQKVNTTLDGFKIGAQIDLEAYKAYLNASVEINRMKVAQQSWWGARVIIMLAGIPASLHFAGVMLDSMPFPYIGWEGWWFALRVHEVGSWGIPKPPAPYDTYQWAIVQSFFIVMPTMPLVSAVSAWLAAKR